MQEIAALLQAAKDNNLGVIPLVQTFGHLEFVLKLEQFKNLREEPSYPQSLCPSREEAVNMVRTMVNQIMEIHRDSTHIHIGCDEVSNDNLEKFLNWFAGLPAWTVQDMCEKTGCGE